MSRKGENALLLSWLMAFLRGVFGTLIAAGVVWSVMKLIKTLFS